MSYSVFSAFFYLFSSLAYSQEVPSQAKVLGAVAVEKSVDPGASPKDQPEKKLQTSLASAKDSENPPEPSKDQAERKEDDSKAAEPAPSALPHHLQQSMDLLTSYEKQLTQELHEEINKKAPDDQILAVARNILKIQDAMVVLKALESIQLKDQK
jgi:hypothetical protein